MTVTTRHKQSNLQHTGHIWVKLLVKDYRKLQTSHVSLWGRGIRNVSGYLSKFSLVQTAMSYLLLWLDFGFGWRRGLAVGCGGDWLYSAKSSWDSIGITLGDNTKMWEGASERVLGVGYWHAPDSRGDGLGQRCCSGKVGLLVWPFLAYEPSSYRSDMCRIV